MAEIAARLSCSKEAVKRAALRKDGLPRGLSQQSITSKNRSGNLVGEKF